MNESVSIFVTVLGIFLELLALIALARLLDAEIPKLTVLVCLALAIAIPGMTVFVLAWGIEPLLIGVLLLGLIPGTSLAAYGIWALVRWINLTRGTPR
jgi:hypothetical protein